MMVSRLPGLSRNVCLVSCRSWVTLTACERDWRSNGDSEVKLPQSSPNQHSETLQRSTETYIPRQNPTRAVLLADVCYRGGSRMSAVPHTTTAHSFIYSFIHSIVQPVCTYPCIRVLSVCVCVCVCVVYSPHSSLQCIMSSSATSTKHAVKQ